MPHIFRVGELTQALKDVVEGQFPFVRVRGQVSNLARPGSGHIYFSLKDSEAVLGVVWFKGARTYAELEGGERFDPVTGEVLEGGERFDPLTGEVLAGGGDPAASLADGADVVAAGRLTVYPPRGAYQLVAEFVQDMGVGRLHLEFEALKRKLMALGWFDRARKRPLPVDPVRVAVITAPGGAAIRDFLRVGRGRGLGGKVRLYPVLVQGEAAPGQIAKALRAAGTDGFAQCVALIRGGGSLEDLWAFNDEQVARAIVDCPVPVITGVGHEVDTTIADLAADLRAATPSHAAQILWRDRETLAQRLDEACLDLETACARRLNLAGQSLSALEKALGWLSPAGQVRRLEERAQNLSLRLRSAGAALLGPRQTRLDDLCARLDRAEEGGLLLASARLEALERRAELAGERLVSARSARFEPLAARLQGLDPMGPLERGYALAKLADGTYLRSVSQVRPGQALDVVVRDGTAHTQVAGTSQEAQ